MEPDSEMLENLQRQYGFEEKEARAFWHLRQAREAFNELSEEDVSHQINNKYPEGTTNSAEAYAFASETLAKQKVEIGQHFSHLSRWLGLRVLHRDYPQGWGYSAPSKEEEDEEPQ